MSVTRTIGETLNLRRWARGAGRWVLGTRRWALLPLALHRLPLCAQRGRGFLLLPRRPQLRTLGNERFGDEPIEIRADGRRGIRPKAGADPTGQRGVPGAIEIAGAACGHDQPVIRRR